MKLVIQRARNASVTINGQTNGSIGHGFVVLVGVTHEDQKEDADYLVRKLSSLRVFEDQDGKMNLSIKEVGGAVLSVSQFTLYGDTRKGNRPSFIRAARPEVAEPLYEYFNQELRKQGIEVQTGIFGADMKVNFTNDGPVTILMDSSEK